MKDVQDRKKRFLLIENYHPNLEPLSGHSCILFLERKNAEARLGHYKRNQHVTILEVEIQSDTEVKS